MKHLKSYQIAKGKLVVSDKLSMCGAFLQIPVSLDEFAKVPEVEQCPKCIGLAMVVQRDLREITERALVPCMACKTPTQDEELLRNDCICDDCAKSIFGVES